MEEMAEMAHRRYAEIMLDVEHMIDDHSELRLNSFGSDFWADKPFS